MTDTEKSPAVLSRILSRSNQYLNSRPKATCSLSSLSRTHIDLPDAPPLLPALVAAGARPDVAQAMQATYHQRACEFREQAMATIGSKLAQIPSMCSRTPDETMVATLQQLYLKKLNSWISEGVALLQEKGPSVLRCREDGERVPAKASKTFNHQYTPLLDHFFEENPFPTHADKVFLARTSGMTYRQIHVWFQNRRNRTKKTLHKKPITERARTLSFDTTIRTLRKSAVPLTTKSDQPAVNQNALVSPSVEVRNALEGVAPPHAFPTIYPPSCGCKPFPSIPTFAVPEWPRRFVPSSGGSSQPDVDVDELTEKFSRLNVWDDSLSRSRRMANMACDGSAATSAITIKPFPAPHPACIRSTIVSLPPRMTLKAIPAPASSQIFRSPSPSSQTATLVPILSHRRKISPLPKRAPSKPLDFSFDPELSRSSLSSSPRSLSFGSESSAQWSTHSSSNSSSAVTTPETLPSPLSHPT